MDPDPQPGESLVSLLDQIRDAAAPPPVPMTPATWAWAVLAGAVALAVAAGLRLWLRHRSRTAYRRAALAELDALAPGLAAGDPRALAPLDRLIRRTALAAFPRAEVATLTGPAWIAFLDDAGGAFAPFAEALAVGPYAPDPAAFDGPGLLAAARRWIVRHHA